MAALEIPCPQCGRRLGVPDRRLLGRLGKCASCGHMFPLREPAGASSLSDLLRPAQMEFAALTSPPPTRPAAPNTRELPGKPVAEAAERLDGLEQAVEELDPPVRARRQRRSGKGREVRWSVAVGLLALTAVGAFWVYSQSSGSSQKNAIPARSAKKTTSGVHAADESGGSRMRSSETAVRSRPGQQPISLKLVPQGARIVVHLRPAAVWGTAEAAMEFRECLGPLATWAEEQMRAKCLVEPAKIDEVLFAMIPVSREDFATAVVVHTKEPFKQSELIERFGGSLVTEPRLHYVNDSRACLIADARTFSIAPAEMAESLVDSVDRESPASDGVRALLKRTDSARAVTLVCELEDVRLGLKTLASETTQPLLAAALDLLGDDVETICWTFEPGDDRKAFNSELLVRHGTSVKTQQFAGALEKRIRALPERLLELTRQTHAPTPGQQKIVQRFPAMTKVVEQSLKCSNSPRVVALSVELPERAGPNLALASWLTWAQIQAADPGRPAIVVAGSKPGGDPSATIAQRLEKKIDVDFRDEFLAAAVQFVGTETGVEFRFDGISMKMVGVTQNERQKFSMSEVPAGAVLHRILSPRGLVLVVDESHEFATVTSRQAAESNKLTPLPLAPAGGE